MRPSVRARNRAGEIVKHGFVVVYPVNGRFSNLDRLRRRRAAVSCCWHKQAPSPPPPSNHLDLAQCSPECYIALPDCYPAGRHTWTRRNAQFQFVLRVFILHRQNGLSPCSSPQYAPLHRKVERPVIEIVPSQNSVSSVSLQWRWNDCLIQNKMLIQRFILRAGVHSSPRSV